MKVLEAYLLTLAWAMAVLLWYGIVYTGFTTPPKGRAADVLRAVFLPLHLILVWNPYPPVGQSRISSLMHFAGRNPKRAFKLVTARNDLDAISGVLTIWNPSWPLDAEFSVLLFHWLKNFQDPVGQTALDLRHQPCMRLVRALTEPSALAALVPALLDIADDQTSAVSNFDVEYGIASSCVLSPDAVRALPCRSLSAIFSYGRPNYHGLDPLAEIFPTELPQELDTALKRVCALFPDMTFAEVESILRRAVPMEPGWSLLAAERISYINPDIFSAFAPLREFGSSIPAIAGLKRAGAPGDLTELALIAASLELA